MAFSRTVKQVLPEAGADVPTNPSEAEHVPTEPGVTSDQAPTTHAQGTFEAPAHTDLSDEHVQQASTESEVMMYVSKDDDGEQHVPMNVDTHGSSSVHVPADSGTSGTANRFPSITDYMEEVHAKASEFKTRMKDLVPDQAMLDGLVADFVSRMIRNAPEDKPTQGIHPPKAPPSTITERPKAPPVPTAIKKTSTSKIQVSAVPGLREPPQSLRDIAPRQQEAPLAAQEPPVPTPIMGFMDVSGQVLTTRTITVDRTSDNPAVAGTADWAAQGLPEHPASTTVQQLRTLDHPRNQRQHQGHHLVMNVTHGPICQRTSTSELTKPGQAPAARAVANELMKKNPRAKASNDEQLSWTKHSSTPSTRTRNSREQFRPMYNVKELRNVNMYLVGLTLMKLTHIGLLDVNRKMYQITSTSNVSRQNGRTVYSVRC